MTGSLTLTAPANLSVGGIAYCETATTTSSTANTLARKDYVDTRDGFQVSVAGDTMTGSLLLDAPANLSVGGIAYCETATTLASTANTLARKDYVDTRDTLRVAVSGDTMTGPLNVGAYSATTDGLNLRTDGAIVSNLNSGALTTASLTLNRGGTVGGGNGWLAGFHRDASTAFPNLVNIGSITITSGGGGVNFNQTSDYRIKDELGEVDDPLGIIAALQPRHLRYKDSGVEFDGFLAHEVQEVVPQAVTGEKDAVYPDDDPNFPGEIQLQQLNTGQIIPYLVGAIQVLTARIEALEAA